MMTRLNDMYEKSIKPELIKKFGYKNTMMVPRLEKIVLNMGLGEAVQNRKIVDDALIELSAIAGQKALPTVSKKSIAGFKLREEMNIGCKVTLRKERMYEFLDRLVNIAMPRIRDFRGISHKSFDGSGNYAMGIREHIIFPEVDYDKVTMMKGLDIVFVTTARTNEEAKELLIGFNMPFAKSS
jgi:large subunit ribosomal protein L5